MAKTTGATAEIYRLITVEGKSLGEAARILKMDRKNATNNLKKYCKNHDLPYPVENTAGDAKPKKVSYPNQNQLNTGGVQRYVVTSMHCNTALNEQVFESFKRYAEHVGAQLCIIPLVYRNPNLFNSGDGDYWWPEEAMPYTIYGNIVINDEWMIAGKLHVQATAARPLQGMQGFSKERSCVIGHARIAWETRPTPPGRPPIRQITTGSISIPQYSDTKLGQLADFHHTQGALLIETDGERTFVRHLRPSTSTGEFYDFEHHYGPEGYMGRDSDAITAAVFGDLHEWFSDEKYLVEKFCQEQQPAKIFMHDALDSFSISPHDEHNPLIRVAKKTLGMDKLDEEIASLVRWHNKLQAVYDGEIIYVESNHPEDHIKRWMTARNWQQIDSNSKIHRYLLNAFMDYLEKPENADRYVRTGELPSVLWLLMDRAGANLNLTWFPSIDESFLVYDIECGQHGHKGPNGARGTPGAFRSSQYKLIIGHIHTPGIYDGVYVVGAGIKRAHYAHGLSGWDTVHATIDKLKKRRLFNTVDGAYRLEV